MNSTVAVKLSADGHKHLKVYYGKNKYSKEYLEKCVKIDGDVLEMQLWELMQVFGSKMYNGNPNLPFQSMNMLISGDDLKEVKAPSKEKEDEER